ncbi:MAG: GNAT family N-acetyltransferase [Candidatus Nanopelagicales bacterium]|nr:GNAT family N-acetyltransferase [Candidatus Nanopelagicales bacterium]
MRDTKLENNAKAKCYEYYFVGELAAFEDYKLDGTVLSLLHTRVIPEYEGQGMAETLVRGILDEAKAKNLQVLPVCEYVAGFIGKHQDEYLELVPAGKRSEFKL